MARRVPIPELIVLAAFAFAAWRFWPVATVDPPETLRCGHPEVDLDCFLPVPGGSLLMGVQATDPAAPGFDPEAQPNEGPPHRVDVSSFWIGRTEVSVGLYRKCVQAGACSEDEVASSGGYSTYYPLSATWDPHQDRAALNSVSWKGADDLCRWLGGRLPTEAEWELAARSPEARRWPWGPEQRCQIPPKHEGFVRLASGAVTTCSHDGPQRADAMPDPGPYGTLGQAGNLWEWTSDSYAPDAYTTHARRDPVHTAATGSYAQRGGSWTATSPFEIRTTVRGGLEPEAKLNDVGFRCVYGGAQ
jgi:formylglycine-generating enzyme required for sulfatase activity